MSKKQSLMQNRTFFIAVIIVIFSLSLLYRLYGFSANPPFWVDEFFTASQANLILKYGLSVFNNASVFFEYHNITTHALVAFFFKLFGQNEFVARLPFVIIGSSVPVLIFILSRAMFGLPTALSAALFATFSYFEITWSRQARGYMLQQFLILCTLLWYFQFQKKKTVEWKDVLIGLFLFIAGTLTHTTYYILVVALISHFLLFHFASLKNIITNIYVYMGLTLAVILAYFTSMDKALSYFVVSGRFGANNLWYYHSFLWREYGLLTFLGLAGFAIALITHRKIASAIVFYVIGELLFYCFIFKPYTSRYMLTIFPFLFIMSSYVIMYFVKSTFFQLQQVVEVEGPNSAQVMSTGGRKLLTESVAIVVALFIIANGHKFVTKPKQFYSVNHDFREIALIDYKQIYDVIKEKKNTTSSPVAIIETLPDRAQWYLGYEYLPLYLFRWEDEGGLVNGISQKTRFVYDKDNNKVISPSNKLILISNIYDLKKIMTQYSKGFILIDDASLPNDVIEYAKSNLKKELYLDHFPLDDNPYSIWPITLYSWGF